MGMTVTTPSGTTANWDGSNLDVQNVDEVNITQTPEPEPTEGPEFIWTHPDDGVVSGPTAAGGGGSPQPATPVQETAPTQEPEAVATKPKSEPVDQKKLDEILKDYPKEFRDRVKFDPKQGDYGKTGIDKDGKLVTVLGPNALKSPEILKSTLDHEMKHVEQARNGNYKASDDKVAAEAVNDIEAYRTELANAQKNGVPKEHIDEINKELQLNIELLKRIDADYYNRVQHGDYTLRPEDRTKISQ
jgi:hypothetical protein